jgi:hypothetical protein
MNLESMSLQIEVVATEPDDIQSVNDSCSATGNEKSIICGAERFRFGRLFREAYLAEIPIWSTKC